MTGFEIRYSRLEGVIIFCPKCGYKHTYNEKEIKEFADKLLRYVPKEEYERRRRGTE